MENIKSINLRLPKDMWVTLKEQSIKEERAMTQIIIELLNRGLGKKLKKS